MPRMVLAPAVVAALAGVCWFMPLVRVVPLGQPAAVEQFNARKVANQLWEEKLQQTFSSAVDATAALKVLVDNPSLTREQYGITPGISRGFLLYLHGEGTVVAVDDRGVEIGLNGSDSPHVILHTAMVFGSTVRDATGLVAFDGDLTSQQFNDLSNELNRLVEEQVIATLDDAARVGAKIEFVGCAEIKSLATLRVPLTIVPVSITVH